MQKYHIVSRVFHWLMAALIIVNLALGLYMIDLATDNKYDFYNFHKSIGVLVILLLLPRIITRLIKKAPSYELTLPNWQLIAAKITHFSLYILMITVATSGYLMSSFYGYPVKLFGLTIPNLVWKDTDLGAIASQTHTISSYILITLVALHIAAVIKHHLKGEKEILKRMT